VVTESGAFAGAIVFAAGGLLAAYYRLRIEYDSTVAFLAVALIAGATQLTNAIVQSHVLEVGLFAAWAALSLAVANRIRSRLLASALVAGAALALPLIAPAVDPPPTLFSSSNGFLALTPVVYIAVIGAVASVTRHPVEFLGAAVALLLWPLTQSSMVPVLAVLAPGLAMVIAWAQRRPLVAAAPLVLGAILWNYWLMVQYTAGTIPKDAPVSFATMVRQQADVATRAPYVYPFALPGSLLSSWRAGIPLGRYDALAAEPQHEVFEITFDRGADRFLLEGWGMLGSDATGPFRPLTGSHATLVFPLRPQSGDIDVHLIASIRRSTAADVSNVDVLINGSGVGRFLASATATSDVRFRVPAADIGRVFRAGYNRLSIVSSGPARLAVHRLRIAPSA
jgi:hypothetical protein